MILKLAIEKAIEGGWRDNKEVRSLQFDWQEIALDPTFWQALAKVLGWHFCRVHVAYGEETNCDDSTHDEWYRKAWIFLGLVLTNGDTEKYWQEILTAN